MLEQNTGLSEEMYYSVNKLSMHELAKNIIHDMHWNLQNKMNAYFIYLHTLTKINVLKLQYSKRNRTVSNSRL
jgi:hypothetical protein